jgi:nitrate reductase molybdenum cofactor assembly chaperone NarJ/NarW
MQLFNKPVAASTTLRVLAHLLGYPGQGLRADLPDLRAALAKENALSASRIAELCGLIDCLMQRPALDTEADYVELFDRGRSTSLHLFEHVHGDSRERGPAMIDLAQTYEKAGLYLAEGEMPDYLPVVLEFTSTQPPREAREFLGEMAHIFNAVFAALQQRGSPYASVLGALLELAGETAQPVKIVPDEAIDDIWQEPPAFDGCSSKGQAAPGQPQPINIVRRARATPAAKAEAATGVAA